MKQMPGASVQKEVVCRSGDFVKPWWTKDAFSPVGRSLATLVDLKLSFLMSHVLVDTAEWRFTVGTAVAPSRQGGGEKASRRLGCCQGFIKNGSLQIFVEWILAKVVE
jgi:hypothetical protein